MAVIPRQIDAHEVWIARCQFLHCRPRAIARPVIYQHDLIRHPQFSADGSDAAMKLGQHEFFVVARRHDGELNFVHPELAGSLNPPLDICVGWVESSRPTVDNPWVSRTRPTLQLGLLRRSSFRDTKPPSVPASAGSWRSSGRRAAVAPPSIPGT